MQLLEPERGFSARRVGALGNRIREGLLRDNKVVPTVLAILVLLVFAWLVAGALVGGPDDEVGQQASNQTPLTPEDSENGGSETPAPSVENRDTESFAAFKPKDPFRQIIPKAKAGEATNESTTSRSGSSKGGGGGRGTEAGGRGGFIEQTSSGGSGSRANGGGGSAGGSGATSGGGGRGAGGSGDTSDGGPTGGGGVSGRGGNGGLFNSGGDLPVP